MNRSRGRVNRRQFVQGVGTAGLGLLAGCGRLPGQAAAPAPHRIGWLSGATGTQPATQTQMAAFNDALQQLGYVEGQNLIIEYRWGQGSNAGLAPLGAELVQRGVQ